MYSSNGMYVQTMLNIKRLHIKMLKVLNTLRNNFHFYQCNLKEKSGQRLKSCRERVVVVKETSTELLRHC